MRKAVVILVLGSVLCCYPAGARAKHRTHRASLEDRSHRVLLMKATAFTRARRPTASGILAHEGIVAADPSVLPFGTRIRITGTPPYDGNYLVADTGSRVIGRRIDLYLPTRAAAKRFGAKTVRVIIQHLGKGKADARAKDVEGRLGKAG